MLSMENIQEIKKYLNTEVKNTGKTFNLYMLCLNAYCKAYVKLSDVAKQLSYGVIPDDDAVTASEGVASIKDFLVQLKSLLIKKPIEETEVTNFYNCHIPFSTKAYKSHLENGFLVGKEYLDHDIIAALKKEVSPKTLDQYELVIYLEYAKEAES